MGGEWELTQRCYPSSPFFLALVVVVVKLERGPTQQCIAFGELLSITVSPPPLHMHRNIMFSSPFSTVFACWRWLKCIQQLGMYATMPSQYTITINCEQMLHKATRVGRLFFFLPVACIHACISHCYVCEGLPYSLLRSSDTYTTLRLPYCISYVYTYGYIHNWAQ